MCSTRGFVALAPVAIGLEQLVEAGCRRAASITRGNPSGAPRRNTSRPKSGRAMSRAPACCIASSRRSRCASAAAISSPLGSSGPGGCGSSKPRLEIGEPRRHHEIIGGDLEPEAARRGDEGEILVGQLQDRDLASRSTFCSRASVEQHVDRPLDSRRDRRPGRRWPAAGSAAVLERSRRSAHSAPRSPIAMALDEPA